MRKTAVTVVLTATATALAAVPGAATPLPAPQNSVHYEVRRDGDTAVLILGDGAPRIVGDQLVVADHTDRPVAAIPLTYQIDSVAYPIDARLDGNTAILTPLRENSRAAVDPGRVVNADQAIQHVAESFNPRDTQALAVFAQRVAIGAAVSTVLGAILGGGIGCLVGGAAGAAISSPVIALLLPFVGATIAGCVLGAATLGAVGGIAASSSPEAP
ncbi:hypothetical protein [Nocardia mexicana]|uniref:DUF8020 domain-containing protein n=1 Tax=Nocardia mexicana TaxID=279262 RepID=A0A370GMD7_9NOCA|nr:hypothetical protein [Nocardia mexicana]RDI44892.1 hypothetical protein DFR68_11544 [Nocardia mexicana]